MTVAVTVYNNTFWSNPFGGGPELYDADFFLAPACTDASGQVPNGAAYISFTYGPGSPDQFGGSYNGFDYPPGPQTGTLTLDGVDGSLSAQSAFDGSTYSIGFQDPHLLGRHWGCAGAVLNTDLSNGYTTFTLQGPPKPPAIKPTAQSASQAFTAQLPKGASIPSAEGLACPGVDLSVILQGYASCFAEYSRGGRWHLASGDVSVRNNQLIGSIRNTGSWRRKWQVCRQHGWRVSGTNLWVPGSTRDTLVSNNNCGAGAPQSDAYFVQQEMVYGCGRASIPGQSTCRVGTKYVGWQFTDSAGFGSIGTYRCSRRARTFVCSNAVGDSFKYTP